MKTVIIKIQCPDDVDITMERVAPEPPKKQQQLIPTEPEPEKPPADVMQVVDAWNSMAGICGLPRVRTKNLSDKRLRTIRQRLRSVDWADWQEAIDKIPTCPFLLGANVRNWRIEFDVFIRPDTVARILEGSFDGSGQTNKHQQRESANCAAFTEFVHSRGDGSSPAGFLLDEADGGILGTQGNGLAPGADAVQPRNGQAGDR